MGAGRALARATARANRAALVGLAGLVAVGLGVSLAAFVIAARTDRAFDDYVERAEVGDLVVNAGLSTARADELITDLEGITSVATSDMLTATFDDGAPREQIEVDSTFTHIYTSRDGRHVRQDRPVVSEGRMPRAPSEVIVNRVAADELGLDVGDPLPIAFWAPSYNTPGVGPAPDEVVSPLGRVETEVVGIVVFPDEVLSEPLYPTGRVLVDYELARPFTCDLGDITAVEDTIESLASVVPTDCSMSYRFWSLRMDEGAEGAAAAAEELGARFEEENDRVPAIAREEDVGYALIPTFTEDERVALDRARSPGVTALRLFGVTAGTATVALGLLAAYRLARRARRDALVWRQLGVPTVTRTTALASSWILAVVVGAVGAVAVAWVVSGLGPIGSSARLEVGTHRSVPLDVVALVGGIAVGALVLGGLAIAASSARRLHVTPAPRSTRWVRLTRRLHPAAALGVGAASSDPSAQVVLVSGIVAVGVVAATSVFVGNVSTLLDQPARYGWPYDAAVVLGFGYGGGDEGVIAQALDRPEVERWGGASLGTVALDGVNLGAVAALSDVRDLAPQVLEGRLPAGPDELAVGRQTLEDLDAEIGDEVDLESDYGGRSVRVTGTVVLPTIGPYESVRAESGRGALLTDGLYGALIAQTEEGAGLEPGTLEQVGFVGFVGIDLADGVDPTRFFQDVGDRRAWDLNGFETLPVITPLRPPALDEAATVQGVPIALGVLLAVAMAGGLALGVATATRGRRRELSVLRAIGCAGPELRSTVRWHAMTVVLVATAVGLPLGISAGRIAARTFLTDLGVSDDVVVPILGVGLVGVAAIATGMAASIGPARRAASLSASTGAAADPTV